MSQTCEYDTGSMYGCKPACELPATVEFSYTVPCYGKFITRLCRHHVLPMAGRVSPSTYSTKVA